MHIEKGNKELLEKMKKIMTRNPKFLPDPRSENLSPAKQKSLHSNMRKKELQRITVENYKILQRLRTKKSNYSTHKWENDHKKQIKVSIPTFKSFTL